MRYYICISDTAKYYHNFKLGNIYLNLEDNKEAYKFKNDNNQTIIMHYNSYLGKCFKPCNLQINMYNRLISLFN